MKLGSENITIIRKARDHPDVPQSKTVYTRAAEKIRRFEIYRQYIGAGCTRSALARQQSFEKVPSSSGYRKYKNTRKGLGALRAPTSSRWPFGPA